MQPFRKSEPDFFPAGTIKDQGVFYIYTRQFAGKRYDTDHDVDIFFGSVSLEGAIAMKFRANQSRGRTSLNVTDISVAIQETESTGPDAAVTTIQTGQHSEWEGDAMKQLSILTPRQHQIMGLVLAGKPSKIIATELGISQRTVESHRAAIMVKTGSKSIPALARLAFMPKVTVPGPLSLLPKLSLV